MSTQRVYYQKKKNARKKINRKMVLTSKVREKFAKIYRIFDGRISLRSVCIHIYVLEWGEQL